MLLFRHRSARRNARQGILARRLHAQEAGRVGLNLANCLLEPEALAGDLRLGERRIHVAQLTDQGGAGALVQHASRLAGILLETSDGLADERVVIGHLISASAPRPLYRGIRMSAFQEKPPA